MGFRSTFITESYNLELPDWFLEKWLPKANFWEDRTFPMSSKQEMKEYSSPGKELAEDLQKAIPWEDWTAKSFPLIWLRECGGITKVKIYKETFLVDGM